MSFKEKKGEEGKIEEKRKVGADEKVDSVDAFAGN